MKCAKCGREFVPWRPSDTTCWPCPGPPPVPELPPRAEPASLGQRERAIVWLTAQLTDGPLEANEVERRAKAANISLTTLKRAKKALDVRSVRVGGLGNCGVWVWQLPSEGNGAR